MIPQDTLLLASPFLSVYEGEEVSEPETPPVEAPAVETPPAKGERVKIKLDPNTQQYVNSLIAEERRRAVAKTDQLITQLETEKNRGTTTAAEKVQLEERIEGLRAEFQTKEELASRSTAKKVQELEAKLKTLEAEGSTWKSRYERDSKRVALSTAAVNEKAYNPDQVVTTLFANSRLVEMMGEDGRPTGEYETRVRMNTRDKDGKTVALDLDPIGAVKQLKEQAEFANLFISAAQGGLGGLNLGKGGSGHAKSPAEMSTEEYMEARRKQRAARYTAK